jgi:hypothetical protein
LKAVSSNELIQSEAELHRKFLFVVFETGHIAMLPEDLAMTGSQPQVHSADHSDGEEHILDALLNPRFRDEWNPKQSI